MTALELLSSAHVWIVAGKGGVGKTTVTAALACAASQLGLSTLVIDVEGRGEVGRLLHRRAEPNRPVAAHESWGIDEIEVRPADPARGTGRISGRAISADAALVSYLADHGLGRLARTMADTGLVDVVTRGAPGIKDILVLGKVKQLERARAADVILVDAPASGHAITFLRAAAGLVDAVRVGPIHQQAREVLELLSDPRRCQVMLVTVAEETPVNELIETAFALEDHVGIQLGPVIVNAVYPATRLPDDVPAALRQAGLDAAAPEAVGLAQAAELRRRRAALQQGELDRLAANLPLAQVQLPYCFAATIDDESLARLSGALLETLGR